MTFWAGRGADRSGRKVIDVHVTYGPISITVNEDPGHLRAFWGDLGRLLDKTEAETT